MRQKEIRPKFTGELMTLEEFHNLNPEFKERWYLPEILEKAKSNTLKLDDVKNFYKLKRLTLNDFKDDQQIYSYNYWNFHQGKGHTEMQYILDQHRLFILKNYLKKSN